MLDGTQQRAAMIEHLEAALGLAGDLGEEIVAFLIERSLDEARGHQFVAIDRTKRVMIEGSTRKLEMVLTDFGRNGWGRGHGFWNFRRRILDG